MKASLLIGLVLLFCWTQIQASDTYFTGSCRNVTHNLDGFLKLVISQTDDNLEGYMSISGALGGSGILKGTREGNRYTFETIDEILNLKIRWQGTLRGSVLSGEYFIAPQPAQGLGKQVGEWEVNLAEVSSDKDKAQEEHFINQFTLGSEIRLNQPVETSSGEVVTGAQALFDSIHPVGNGLNVCVTDLKIQWKDDSAHQSYDDIYKFTLEYVLFWQGFIRPFGSTKLRLTYNTALDSVTSHEVLQSTGTTNEEVGKGVVNFGSFLGKAAMGAFLNGL